MMQTAYKKLNSTRGSGIAEALIGFLISVLSVITLLSVTTTTLELIKQSDRSILVLYEEEGAMDQFINGKVGDPDAGTVYTHASESEHFTINARGNLRHGETFEGGNPYISPSASVKYYLTNRHHLFGFVPSLS